MIQRKNLPFSGSTSSILLVLILVGCASDKVKSIKPENFSTTQVENMLFYLHDSSGNELEKFTDQEFRSVSSEISDRFHNAGYPLTDVMSSRYYPDTDEAIPDRAKDSFSHALEVSVGQSERTNTPSGLSFTFGNSDPRSTDFQKALTVPVSCKLVSLEDKHPPIVLTERKTAVTDFDKLGIDQSGVHKKTKRFYIENIGATCHNLLVKLDIYPDRPVSEDEMKKLLPGVRIETTYKTDPAVKPQKNTLPSKLNADAEDDQANEDFQDETTAQLMTKDSQSNSDHSESKSSLTESIKTENNQEEDWRNQQITIFNQGDTVILEFGYERR